MVKLAQDDPQDIINSVRSQEVTWEESVDSISPRATIGLQVCHHRTHVKHLLHPTCKHLRNQSESHSSPMAWAGAMLPAREGQVKEGHKDRITISLASRLSQSEGDVGCVE